MKYEYTHLIPENVAPKGTTRIVVKSGNKEVCSIPAARFGDLTPPEGEPLYSFGLISDTHLAPGTLANDGTNLGTLVSTRLDNALTWYEERGVRFVAICGDVTNVGFDNPRGTYDPVQFEEYKAIRQKHPNLPVYSVTGNHDNYHDGLMIRYCESQGKFYHEMWKEYTDPERYIASDTVEYDGILNLNYTKTVEHDGVKDLYIFMSMTTNAVLYADGSTTPLAEYVWLENQLKGNPTGRNFVFWHPIFRNDSGNPLGLHTAPNYMPEGYAENTLISILASYKNTVLFHGHAHWAPWLQELDPLTNYSYNHGFHSVHVPSLGQGAILDEQGAFNKTHYEGYGYLVDVYQDCICLRGRDFVRNEWLGIGTYRIEVTA